jgi:hypothetical protein
MEDFNVDLTLDEAAEARIAHAEFLTTCKDWATKLSATIQPFVKVADILAQDDVSPDEIEKLGIVFPMGLRLVINQLNEFYDLMQKQAIKVLGAPFALHKEHNEDCDGTKDKCGHQDHWLEKEGE